MSSSIIGQPVTRIDGREKVTGAARYAVDHPIQEVAYGVGIASTIGNGRISRVDSSAAEKMRGVLAVLHHGNTKPLYHPAGPFEEQSRPGESRPPLADDAVHYYGQFVALVVADTLEQAQDAASQVRVEYTAESPRLTLDQAPPEPWPAAEYSRGEAESAFERAVVKLEATYEVPAEMHNPMELHGTIAVWNQDKVTLYETSQGVVNHHNVAAQVLGMPLESIEVISPFVGSGFGSKLFPWPHSWLAAIGARQVGRPVKVVVPRSLMFTTTGHRPNTRQRIRVGASTEGKLVALTNDVLQHTSTVDDYLEDCVAPAAMLYSCPNVKAVQRLVRLNVGTPTPMRGPGRVPALFALESALDELAVKLNIDPVEIRLRNDAARDESNGRPWSSKHLREAFQIGAERFGWSKRDPKVGSMRKGDKILGWGMAACNWPGTRHSATVRVTLLADGTARAVCATQDIGTGTYTVFAQVVADKTGVPVNKVQVRLGDSALPPGPTSGGSSATATVLPAISQATQKAIDVVLNVAVKNPKSPFHNLVAGELKMGRGRVHRSGQSPDEGVPFQEILAMQNLAAVDGESTTTSNPAQKEFSIHSFGAHFCEVTFDPEIADLRVTRWVTVIDGGRIINAKTARNQILGAVVMGIGMGMLERAVYDSRTGQPINNNFADYLVAVNADIPDLDCIFLDYPDPVLDEFGARGIGEIGLTGCAPALASATYHATGVRVRTLPIRIEDLLGEA